MQVNKGDQVKVAILIVAIVGVLAFAVKTAFFRGQPSGEAPAPAPAPTAKLEPGPTAPGTNSPAVPTDAGKSKPSSPGNPFRTTVSTGPTGDGQPSGSSAETPPPVGGSLGGTQPWTPDEIPEEVEFRLDGVIVGGRPYAIVTRDGETTHLTIGSKAPYGYRVSEITANGIRLRQKNRSKFVRVGERLDPPTAPAGGSGMPSGLSGQWTPPELPDVRLPASNDGLWLTDLSAAKDSARKSKKMIFVDFMATWCGPCKKLDSEVFQTSKFRSYRDEFVFLRVDVDAQKDLARAYKIEAMPTLMVLDAAGKVVKSIVGYGGPSRFYSFLDSASNR